jgi:hypothetical protein
MKRFDIGLVGTTKAVFKFFRAPLILTLKSTFVLLPYVKAICGLCILRVLFLTLTGIEPKTIVFSANETWEEETFNCPLQRRSWNGDGYNYTDEQVESIRDFLYLMAEIQLEHFESMESQEDNLPSDNLPVKAGRSVKKWIANWVCGNQEQVESEFDRVRQLACLSSSFSTFCFWKIRFKIALSSRFVESNESCDLLSTNDLWHLIMDNHRPRFSFNSATASVN